MINYGQPGDPNQQADAQAIAAYPQMAWALADGELGPVLRQAAAGGWDASRLEGALHATNWWRTHDDAAQAWADTAANDPAEAASRTQAEVLNIRNSANQMGVNLSAAQLTDIATQVLSTGMTPAEVQNLLGGFLQTGQMSPGLDRGNAAATAQDLQKLAADYLVPVSNGSINAWTQQIAQGAADINGFKAYLQEQAKSLFPGLGAAIDAGITPGVYVDPYKQIASRVLGITPDSINFMDPKWMRALQQVDPKTGVRTSMSLADWGTTLMSDPTYGYSHTQNGQDRAAAMVQGLGELFGKTAGVPSGFAGAAPPRF